MASLLRLRSPLLRRFPSLTSLLSSSSSSSHAADACDSQPNTSSDDSQPNTTSDDSQPNSTSDDSLLLVLRHLIRDHSRESPLDPGDLTPGFTIPSLTSAVAQHCPTPLPPPLVDRLIRSCAAAHHDAPFPQTLSLFNWWTSTVDSADAAALVDPFLAMLDFAGKSCAFSVAWHLLDQMRDLGVPLTWRAFFPIVRRYVRAGRAADAAEAFARMEHYGCKPDLPAFSDVIALLSKKRHAAEAQAFFDRFRDRFPPDVVVYTALIHAWCRAYRIDEGERIFLEMKEKGITPNVYTYTVVIDALCRAGQINRAQEVFVQMLDAGCAPNAATFNSLMRVHVKAGRTEKALEVYNQMRRMGCMPDLITYNSLIDAHCKQGNLDAALKVLNQMTVQECAPDANSFNPILGCIMKLGDVNAARKMYERMRDSRCRPSTLTYNLLMEMFGKSKSLDMVVKMKKEMDGEGVVPNLNTYDILITLFCGVGNWNRAHRLLEEMVNEKGLKPKNSMNQMVLECLRKAGQLKKHEELVEKLVSHGFLTRAV